MLIDAIVEYVSSSRGIPPQEFLSFTDDIEELHPEIQDRLIDAIRNEDVKSLLSYREIPGVDQERISDILSRTIFANAVLSVDFSRMTRIFDPAEAV